ETRVRRRHDERRADGAQAYFARDVEENLLPVVPHVEQRGRAAFDQVAHAERGDSAQLLHGELLRGECGQRQQDAVDELRNVRLQLEVVRYAAEQAAADAVRVQVDESGEHQAVLVADDFLARGRRVTRD